MLHRPGSYSSATLGRFAAFLSVLCIIPSVCRADSLSALEYLPQVFFALVYVFFVNGWSFVIISSFKTSAFSRSFIVVSIITDVALFIYIVWLLLLPDLSGKDHRKVAYSILIILLYCIGNYIIYLKKSNIYRRDVKNSKAYFADLISLIPDGAFIQIRLTDKKNREVREKLDWPAMDSNGICNIPLNASSRRILLSAISLYAIQYDIQELQIKAGGKVLFKSSADHVNGTFSKDFPLPEDFMQTYHGLYAISDEW
ncbi:MAG: hypothetical protein JWQ38_2758 [Flavipsychrobacter sp.]|nr:hypothetical protein [Flavipsychrobacter sp.]